jgi:hypothetical protein
LEYKLRYADRILNRIPQLRAKEFGVYACREADGTHRVSLLAEFKDREAFMLPMTLEAAHEMAIDMLKTVMVLKPEIMFPAGVAQKFKNGELSLEQLKELVWWSPFWCLIVSIPRSWPRSGGMVAGGLFYVPREHGSRSLILSWKRLLLSPVASRQFSASQWSRKRPQNRRRRPK